MPDSELLTTSQVLEWLQIGRTKLWELVREGAFPAYRLGPGRNAPLRYRRGDVIRWLERHRVEPDGSVARVGPTALSPLPREG